MSSQYRYQYQYRLTSVTFSQIWQVFPETHHHVQASWLPQPQVPRQADLGLHALSGCRRRPGQELPHAQAHDPGGAVLQAVDLRPHGGLPQDPDGPDARGLQQRQDAADPGLHPGEPGAGEGGAPHAAELFRNTSPE
ncbi:hypothetical protein CEXT_683181 [Caerostris extrusa]|uniref:Uncharacterized protein n=1 Tax=Caerostris extrusa TaxID=172846 RepID=A0AAV4V7Z2_CAEEX|nr:hypothetical protein CEXT_683181 [Caerostris extrusa]